MSQGPVTVTVNIMGRSYQVATPPQEQAALEQSANYLDSQMRKIRAAGKVVGTDRIAVMAALNLTHELLALRRQLDQLSQEGQQQVDGMAERIDRVLEEVKALRR